MRALGAHLLAGAAAGAAGTTALHAVTYLDMAVRGRPPSRTPERTVERVSRMAGVPVPGRGAARRNRVAGVGSLLGMATGVTIGALAGAVRGGGLRVPYPIGALLTSGITMVLANGPMTVLGITDPRSWTRADWLSDVVPHIAYGAVTSATLRGLIRQ